MSNISQTRWLLYLLRSLSKQKTLEVCVIIRKGPHLRQPTDGLAGCDCGPRPAAGTSPECPDIDSRRERKDARLNVTREVAPWVPSDNLGRENFRCGAVSDASSKKATQKTPTGERQQNANVAYGLKIRLIRYQPRAVVPHVLKQCVLTAPQLRLW